MNRTFEQADPADWPQIVALLRSVELPLDGLLEHLGTTLVVRINDKIVGCAALEIYGDLALLRSVAVNKSHQGHGLGHELTQASLDLARQRCISRVYLLTDTAEDYFPRFGFKSIDRSAVPQAVQQSVEFTSACPVSALVMVYSLQEKPTSS
jgi:amino-acid N-acetyltransferase